MRLRLRFPSDYPMSPPFVWLVSPRLALRTGFVSRGAICTNMLVRPAGGVQEFKVWIAAHQLASSPALSWQQL